MVIYACGGDVYGGVRIARGKVEWERRTPPFSRFAFVDVKVDACEFGPDGPSITEIGIDQCVVVA